MKTTKKIKLKRLAKSVFATLAIALFATVTASCSKDDKDIFINNPNKVLKTATFKTSTDSSSVTEVFDFHYDSNKRVSYINFKGKNVVKGKVTEDDKFKIEYTYDNLNRVQNIRLLEEPMYLSCAFTYYPTNMISGVKLEGSQNEEFSVKQLADNYFVVLENGTNELKFKFHTSDEGDIITSLTYDEDFEDMSKVDILYDANLKNGHTNFGAQIGVPTFLFTSISIIFSFTFIYPSVFDAKVVKEFKATDGYIMVVNNESDNLGFVTKSTHNSSFFGNITTCTYTYQLLD